VGFSHRILKDCGDPSYRTITDTDGVIGMNATQGECLSGPGVQPRYSGLKVASKHGPSPNPGNKRNDCHAQSAVCRIESKPRILS
jgi:hypothetical protein